MRCYTILYYTVLYYTRILYYVRVCLLIHTDGETDGHDEGIGLKMGGRKRMLIKITNWRAFEVRS